jgi:hypothetical protein
MRVYQHLLLWVSHRRNFVDSHDRNDHAVKAKVRDTMEWSCTMPDGSDSDVYSQTQCRMEPISTSLGLLSPKQDEHFPNSQAPLAPQTPNKANPTLANLSACVSRRITAPVSGSYTLSCQLVLDPEGTSPPQSGATGSPLLISGVDPNSAVGRAMRTTPMREITTRWGLVKKRQRHGGWR